MLKDFLSSGKYNDFKLFDVVFVSKEYNFILNFDIE